MHFPKYWRLVSRGGVSAWGWSDESLEQAGDDGEGRVGRIVEWLRGGAQGDRELGSYGYPDRPMREPVLREFHSGGELVAVVSRNSYGCEVLNTSQAFFVDVDVPPPGLFAAIAALFRGGRNFEQALLAKVDGWVADEPQWGWRVYRTRAGFRLLATQAPISPDDPDCGRAFELFGADRLYRRLCENQQCFRARLTPKPWRCGIEKQAEVARWPWPDAEAEAVFHEWLRRYESSTAGKATCRLIGTVGNGVIHPALEQLVEVHDEVTRATSRLQLA